MANGSSDIDAFKEKVSSLFGELMSPGGVLSDTIVDSTRAVMNSMFPNDFEYYMIGLELVDSMGNRKAYFVFPVMPSSYSQGEPKIVNVKKTMGGVNVVGNNTFVPFDIQLAGNFGRKLRVMLGGNELFNYDVARLVVDSSNYDELYTDMANPNPGGAWKAMRQSLQNKTGIPFNARIKTGYGAMKVLEQLISMDGELDKNGKPYRLYMYNPSLGHNFLVKVIRMDLNQTMAMNGIWNYTLSLKAVAPLSYIVEGNRGVKSAVATNMVQKAVNSTFQAVKKSLRIEYAI